MSVEIEGVTLREYGESIFDLPQDSLPTSAARLKRSLVAECCRLALASASKRQEKLGILHVLALRNWVVRKLRSVMSEFLDGRQGLFLDVLRDSKAPTLEFLGDIIPLSAGYYCSAPSRVVSVAEDEWILVSGEPTYQFTRLGLPIKVHGVGRRIEGVKQNEILDLGLPIQTRESYMGLTSTIFDADSFQDLERYFEKKDWRPEAGWEAYLGDTGQWGFEWGEQQLKVSTPAGLASFWREPREVGVHRFWLRVISGSDDSMFRIPTRTFKHVCLEIDRLKGQPRTVVAQSTGDGIVVSMNFSPPAAQTRWLHGVGAEWLGSTRDAIRWLVPRHAWAATEGTLKRLPIQVA